MEAVEAEGRKSPPLSLKVANSKQNENRWLAPLYLFISCNISSATITYRFLAPLSYVGYRKGSRIGWIHQRVLTPQGKSHLDLPWAKKSPCGSPRGNSYRLLTSRRSTLSFSQPISFGLVERKLS